VPGVPGLEFAGGAPRVVAYVIDAIIITILNVIVGIVLGIVVLAVAPNLGARPIVGLLIGAAIDAAYFMLLWTSAARATLGMRVLNLQVGNAFDGRRLETGQAFRRWVALGSWISIAGVTTSLAGITGLIGFAWAVVLLLTTISSPTKQGLHDRFANTAVVRPAGASSSVIIGCLVIVVLLFAALALAVIVSFGVLAPLSS
jgi:uncharacterized RDD family membrane protein YckC